MRHTLVGVATVLLFGSTADASVITIYKEVETITAAISVTGADGVTHSSSQTANGALLAGSSPLGLSVVSRLGDMDLPPGYLDNEYLAASAWVSRIGGNLDGFVVAENFDCEIACRGSARADVDFIFRPQDNAGIQARFNLRGGVAGAVLVDLTTSTVLHRSPTSRFDARIDFDFPNTQHLYRFAAFALTELPPGGDPEIDFSVRFRDSITDLDATVVSPPVPEPASLLLLSAGAAVLAVRRRRKEG